MLERDGLEGRRLALQAKLDEGKTAAERNRLGQFATPTPLADELVRTAAGLMASGRVRFLDPAIGTGAFYSALRRAVAKEQIETAVGYEIDSHYSQPALALWDDGLLQIRCEDYTTASAPAIPEERFNLIVCNPPYVRHHHIEGSEKPRMKRAVETAAGVRLDGLSGLYCYFLGLAHRWMSQGAVAAWLVPSEFMDVKYGRGLKQYLLDKVALLRVHRFDPNEVQFTDALVSSAVVLFRRSPSVEISDVEFTYGGSLTHPSVTRRVPVAALRKELKWTRFPRLDVRAQQAAPTLGELFYVKRGLATGDNGFFILDRHEIETRHLPMQFFRPILPSPRHLKADEVQADEDGVPLLPRPLFLLDCRLSEAEVRRRHSTLWDYFSEGREKEVDQAYLAQHRIPWYTQEDRPPAPIVCSYMGRHDAPGARPFRFILNHSHATASNSYLMLYPRPRLAAILAGHPGLLPRMWEALRAIEPRAMLDEGRVYGGGLHKMEPKELGRVPVGAISELVSSVAGVSALGEADLFSMQSGRSLVPD